MAGLFAYTAFSGEFALDFGVGAVCLVVAALR